MKKDSSAVFPEQIILAVGGHEGAVFDGKVAWYENDGGSPPSFTEHVISIAANGDVRSVFATDVDGDGDTDVLSASFGDNKIVWYENTSPPPDCSGINNCSGHGTCVGNNICGCDAGWLGEDCSCMAGACSDDDVCTRDLCIGAGLCSNTPGKIYGDVDNDDDVDLFDLFCMLNCFRNDFTVCSFDKCDLEPCVGDADVDLFDLFAVLNAFSGDDPCCGG